MRQLLLPPLILCIATLMNGACHERVFVGEEPVFQLAITPETIPIQETEDSVFFLVEQRVEVPVRQPDEMEQALLGEPAAPFESTPWIVRGDHEIEIDWVLINLDEEPRELGLVVNGFNQFHEYLPGFSEIDEEVVPDFAQWERTIVLGPLERRSGSIREEELDEVAADLATVVNGAPNSHQIVHPQSQSGIDPRAQAFVPTLVPGLMGVRVGLRSNAEVSALLEFTVRVREVEGKLITDPEEPVWPAPAPVPFEPVVPELD